MSTTTTKTAQAADDGIRTGANTRELLQTDFTKFQAVMAGARQEGLATDYSSDRELWEATQYAARHIGASFNGTHALGLTQRVFADVVHTIIADDGVSKQLKAYASRRLDFATATQGLFGVSRIKTGGKAARNGATTLSGRFVGRALATVGVVKALFKAPRNAYRLTEDDWKVVDSVAPVSNRGFGQRKQVRI